MSSLTCLPKMSISVSASVCPNRIQLLPRLLEPARQSPYRRADSRMSSKRSAPSAWRMEHPARVPSQADSATNLDLSKTP